MTYAILFIENGDFVADFDSEEEARHALQELVDQYPSVRDRVGMMAFDDDGMPAGDFMRAADVEPHHV